MTRAIEPVQTPDICLCWVSAEPPRIMGASPVRLLAYFRIIGRDQWPPPACPRHQPVLTHLPVARLPGRTLPRAPGLGCLVSCFLKISLQHSWASQATTLCPLSATHSCCCQETRVVFSSLRYLPPWCVYLPGFWWFHDPRVALLEWTLDFCRDIASSAFNPARVQYKSAQRKTGSTREIF